MTGNRDRYASALTDCCRFYCRILLLVFVAVVVGCSPQTRHGLLTVFFTGVPPLEGEQGVSAAMAKAPGPGEKTSAHRPGTVAAAATASVRPKQQYYAHPLWQEGTCTACHQVNKLFSFTPVEGGGKHTANSQFYAGGGMPGPLLRTKEKLCNGCHTDKGGLQAIRDGLWIHNTAAKGDCLACHDPHQSGHVSVLRKPADQLCRSCHPEAKLADIAMQRQEDEPCLSCHNPHLGKDRRLLLKDHREVKQTARRAL